MSLLYEFEVNESLDVGFCVEYESFSFDPILTDHILEKSKFKFVESKTFMPMTVDLDQTLKNVKIKQFDLSMMITFLGQ